ncbi:hypothetical protein ACTFIT_001761 [Dictyostelium discoideum]
MVQEAPTDIMSIFLYGKRIEGTNVGFICKLVNVLDKTKSIKKFKLQSRILKFQKESQNIGNFEWDWNWGCIDFIESKLITKGNGCLSKDDKLTIKLTYN